MSANRAVSPREDAQKVFQVLRAGGIAILPLNVGYGIVAADPNALNRIFTVKKRRQHKRHAMIGSFTLHREIHSLPQYEADMVKLLTVDLDLPLGVVAPYRADHPMMKRLGPNTLLQSTIGDTLAMLVNGGQLQEELSQLAFQAGLAILGSSANLTGTGAKILVDDIEPEIKASADIIIDYGRQKYSNPHPSSTMIDFKNRRLLRIGACYDVIQDALLKFFGIDLPDDPGRHVSFPGHTIAPKLQW
ncbi:hypothetical protein N7532_004850 [Penicillium argentinense]|uniref:Threonylcarbamoyl-AMP synthase n=1 Tax=Penicillium argentinense TaxID=1131581 RepID=A0A9W9FD38_9EURO|nr:uncharacterized protein N7532_004850 [Penicillium argentinense]KAJ5097849.1 hypothetical protein N7532_004850 [Penicillium argentinense]